MRALRTEDQVLTAPNAPLLETVRDPAGPALHRARSF
jgi:hypothetical protein